MVNKDNQNTRGIVTTLPAHVVERVGKGYFELCKETVGGCTPICKLSSKPEILQESKRLHSLFVDHQALKKSLYLFPIFALSHYYR